MSAVTETKKLTYRQSRAVERFVRDGCRNMSKALREVGYSRAVYTQPQKVFGSEAVQLELERRGFVRQPAKKVKDKVVSLPSNEYEKVAVPFDPRELTQEQLLELKIKLSETPDPYIRAPETPNKPISSFGSMEAVFDVSKAEYSTTYDNFSSL